MTNSLLGRAGELLVCLDFIKTGYAAALESFPNSPCDVIADINGKFLRIQVKSTAKPRVYTERRKHWTGYEFKWTQRANAHYHEIDILAFVAFDLGVVYYRKASDIGTNRFSLGLEKFKVMSGNLKEILRAFGNGS